MLIIKIYCKLHFKDSEAHSNTINICRNLWILSYDMPEKKYTTGMLQLHCKIYKNKKINNKIRYEIMIRIFTFRKYID